MNSKKIILPITAAAALIAAGGCGTRATYVEPTGSRLITSVNEINIQDFAKAADAMTQSLIDNAIATGKVYGPNGKPALMAISRIVNNTGEQIDVDLLIKRMRVALLRTGKVQTTTTMGLGGPEDPLAASYQQDTRIPDYTLSGRIIQSRAQAGRIRQSAFVFQLSLSSNAGIAIWEDEKTIVKQGSRNTVGF